MTLAAIFVTIMLLVVAFRPIDSETFIPPLNRFVWLALVLVVWVLYFAGKAAQAGAFNH